MPYLLRLKSVLAARPTRLIISCPTSQIDLYGTPITCKNKVNFFLIKPDPVGKVTSSVFHRHCPVQDRFIVPGTQRGFRVCFVHTTASGDTEMCKATVATLICVLCV